MEVYGFVASHVELRSIFRHLACDSSAASNMATKEVDDRFETSILLEERRGHPLLRSLLEVSERIAVTHRYIAKLVTLDDKHKIKVGEPCYPSEGSRSLWD